jgi:hypothetical protein
LDGSDVGFHGVSVNFAGGDLVVQLTATKQSQVIQISQTLLDDCAGIDRAIHLVSFPEDATPEEIEAGRRWQVKHDALKAAGLLDDHGHEIKITDCPACTYLGEDDSIRCERKRGHKGSHKFTSEW